MSEPSASATVQVAADPKQVYALVTNLSTLAQLAEETAAMRWRSGDSARPGAVFKGTNRNGWRRWTTTCKVTDAEPGRRFAFDVTHTGVPISRWAYEITPTEDGCEVTESTWDRRPGWFRPLAKLATGVDDRGGTNAQHIEATLRRLKSRAETEARTAG
jgi:hypothetical protein